MKIIISERENPREEELQKQLRKFMLLDRTIMSDGSIKELIMTPTGRIVRFLDPVTKKVLNQSTHHFTSASDNRMKSIEEDMEQIEKPISKNIQIEETIPLDLNTMSLSQIARIIRGDWDKINFAAVPYLNAMRELNKITDNYGYDNGASIVAYFLANASQWKGVVAKAVKLELNKRLKNFYRRR